MTTLQEYLNQKYPTKEDKEQLKDLNLEKISQEREEQGETELLAGGELDLTAFKNLVEIEIYRQFLTTPITKLSIEGLTNLKTLIWPDQVGDSEEEKKLWTELGIADLSTINNQKRKVVKEVRRLAELKGVKVNFATEKYPQEKLGDKNSLTEKTDSETNIYLQLARKDKQGNLCPNLIFWTLTYELSTIEGEEADKNPSFWTHFEEQKTWVKDNLNENYQKEFELLLKPSTFPTNQLEIKELLTVYYPNSEITDSQSTETAVRKEIVDKTWQTIREKILELANQELTNNLAEEKLKELVFKAQVDYNANYKMQVQYHPKSPFQNEIRELITTIPLQLENELLKQEKEVLPTSENFEKLQEQNRLLDNSLESLTDEETYQKIKAKINEIK